MNMFFKRQNQASTATVVASIKAKIAKEQTHLATLQAKHGEAALDAEAGDDKALNEVTSELAKAKNHLADLEAALVAAEKREQAEIAAKRQAEWQEKVENLRRRLVAMQPEQTACAKLSVSLRKLTKIWPKVVPSAFLPIPWAQRPHTASPLIAMP